VASALAAVSAEYGRGPKSGLTRVHEAVHTEDNLSPRGGPRAPPAVCETGGPVMLVANTGWNMVRFRDVLIEALRSRGIEVVAVADLDRAEAGIVQRLGAFPVALPIDAAGHNPIRDLAYLWRVFRLLRRHRPAAVHLFTLKPVVYGAIAAKLAGVPVIVASITGRGILGADHKTWLRPLLWALARLALSGRTRCIFQNRDDLTWFVEHRLVGRPRASHIPGSGVDTEALRPTADVPAAERRTFVMASRMLWSKGVADFVTAAHLVRAHCPEARFVLFGGAREDYGSPNPDFIERDWLEALNREGVVTWRGRTDPDAVEAAMRSAAAVVLPSYYAEGVPRSLIEAAAAGTPVITTDTPGCRDAVIPDRSGFLCPPRAPQRLAEAMLALLDEPHRITTMGQGGRSLAVRRFDSRLVTERTLDVYACARAKRGHPA